MLLHARTRSALLAMSIVAVLSLLQSDSTQPVSSAGESIPQQYRQSPVAYDLCLRDQGAVGLLRINTFTSEFEFVKCGAGGFTVNGTGKVELTGCAVLFIVDEAGVRIRAQVDACLVRGSAVVQLDSGRGAFRLSGTEDGPGCRCPV